MSVTANSMNETSSPAERWRLWIDGCGGYLLLTGEEWEVGGAREHESPAISARADWPRKAGKLVREDQDYFWQPAESKQQLVIPGTSVPISGSAVMTLNCPSSLSNSAVLTLTPPHRFGGHVDAIILVDKTLVIGPGETNHIRTHHFSDQAVMVKRADGWHAKLATESKFASFSQAPQNRITLGSLVMALEKA